MTRKRILVIDDEVSITHSIKLNLESLGTYEVRAENHGVAAIQSAREFKPDLILLDVMMPGMDGGEVAARLQADPLLHNTPLIFLTAIVSKSETHGSEAYIGGHSYMAKPVELSELVQVIETHLHI